MSCPKEWLPRSSEEAAEDWARKVANGILKRGPEPRPPLPDAWFEDDPLLRDPSPVTAERYPDRSAS